MDEIREKLRRQKFWYNLFCVLTIISGFTIGCTSIFLVGRWVYNNCGFIFQYPYNIITYGLPVFLIVYFLTWIFHGDFSESSHEEYDPRADGELIVFNKIEQKGEL
jgi:hypothetical protein